MWLDVFVFHCILHNISEIYVFILINPNNAKSLEAVQKCQVTEVWQIKTSFIYKTHLFERKKCVSDDAIAVNAVSDRERDGCQTLMPNQILELCLASKMSVCNKRNQLVESVPASSAET